MPTVIEIDEYLAKAAADWARSTGRSLAQYVEDAVAGELLSRPLCKNEDAVPGPVEVADFGGDGTVDGLPVDRAIARAEAEHDAAVARGHLDPVG